MTFNFEMPELALMSSHMLFCGCGAKIGSLIMVSQLVKQLASMNFVHRFTLLKKTLIAMINKRQIVL